jgi:RimJ/RimL family protein N-acetyltransferase
MKELLEWLFAIGWKRIVVPVTSNAGRGIRRALREMGFENEGTLRAAQLGFNTRSATEEYLDVDVWAILKEGDRNGL